MKEKPELLKLNKFLPFICAYAHFNSALVVLDSSGKLLLSETAVTANHSFSKLLNSFLNQVKHSWKNYSSLQNVIQVTSQTTLLKSYFELGASQEPLYLALITQQNLTETDQQILLSQLSETCNGLLDDYNLEIALAGMADELAVRYEELNLFYAIDESKSQANNNENEALQQLIINSSDYLNVDLIWLYLPGQQPSIQHLAADNQLQNQIRPIMDAVQNSLYPLVLENKETLVINHDTDTDWTDGNFKVPCKLIAAPVRTGNKKQIGILLLINALPKSDFSNSDRKLCEVLAAEASKLIKARRDKLTGFYNRQGFMERFENSQKSNNDISRKSVLLFLDIDQFKVINDTSGQIAGDQLLKQIGAFIKQELNENDILARLSSDEFLLLFENCSLSEAKIRADKIQHNIKQFRYIYEEKMFDIAISIGVVIVDSESDGFSQLMAKADMACNIAKELGGNRIHVYQASDQSTAKHEDELQWISRINKALEEDRFVLFKQAIVPLQTQTNQEQHFEILLRLRDENNDIISPFFFIPAAERYNLMSKIDRWVVKNALKKMAAANTHQIQPSLFCSINLSGQSISEPGFVEFIVDQIRKSGVPTQTICFEITETAAVSNLTQAIDFINALKKIGCRISLDDFGSGMSSFTYLKNLPVDYLKIDGYFVKTLLENKIDHAMVASINQIGQVMQLKTIAEFVENDAIFEELKTMGIDYGQGYGIGKPEPFDN